MKPASLKTALLYRKLGYSRRIGLQKFGYVWFWCFNSLELWNKANNVFREVIEKYQDMVWGVEHKI